MLTGCFHSMSPHLPHVVSWLCMPSWTSFCIIGWWMAKRCALLRHRSPFVSDAPRKSGKRFRLAGLSLVQQLMWLVSLSVVGTIVKKGYGKMERGNLVRFWAIWEREVVVDEMGLEHPTHLIHGKLLRILGWRGGEAELAMCFCRRLLVSLQSLE